MASKFSTMIFIEILSSTWYPASLRASCICLTISRAFHSSMSSGESSKSIAITIPNPDSILSDSPSVIYAISKSSPSSINSHTFTVFSSISVKLPAFASFIISFTSFPNFGPMSLPFGLQIFDAIVELSTVRTSFTLSSSLIISL